MAEGMAFGLVKEVLGKLGSALWDEIGLLRSFKDDADDLRSNFSAIQAVLLDAEERSSVEIEGSHALRDWLGKLKDAAYDADDLLDLIRTEALLRKQQHKLQNQNQPAEKVRGFLSHANPMHLKVKRKMAHRMKELRKKIDKIAKQRHDFGLVEAGSSRRAEFKRRPETTMSVVDEKEIVGRDDDKEEIVKLLLETGGDHDVSVIPIVGLGGLGKTTLAQLAFNDGRVTGEQRFDLLVWVCMSTDFDMKTIAKAVTYVAQKKCVELDNPEAVARYLVEIFSQHRFLLVLDDVWNEDPRKWDELKVIFKDGKKGSKILVTTRNEKVAKIMETVEPHRLKGLSDDDCWELFRRLAFKEGEEDEYLSLVEIGKQIVNKCGGVPLAAKALGSMMFFKRTEDAWSAIRDSQIWMLEEEKKILSLLKWSYIQMPSALKRCFAYCSIFPKDSEIYKDDLIQQWIALGFISSRDTTTLMEDIGNEYFDELLWRSFLLETCRGGDACRMHDLVHDLAQSVAREEVAVIVGENSTRSIPEGCRYASIRSRSIQQVPTTVKQRLRALRFAESASLTTICSEAKSLRLLALPDFEISMLPRSICKLKLLRYLNLSRSKIEELPESITGLCNLQTLNLSCCREIRTLPKSLGSLVNLRILDLSNCGSLIIIPDSISNLQNLYKLNLRLCEELRSLEPICHLKNLHDLTLSYLRNLQALPESIGNLKNLRILNLSHCSSLLSLPSSLSDLQYLEKLDIRYCSQLCELPKMIQKLTKLRELLNNGCRELKGMPRGIGKLVSLQKLSVFVVGRQGSIEHYASISELKQLNNLVGELEIYGLKNVTNPVDAKAANLIAKKKLRSLELKWNALRAAEDMDTVQPAEEMDGVLGNLQPHQNLANLVINGYEGGKFPSWMMNSIDSCLPNLVEITNKFSALRRLYLSDMPVLQEWVTHRRNKFPALVELTLERMPMLREWVTVDDEEGRRERVPLFPCLDKLWLQDCPQLRPEPCLPASVQNLIISRTSEENLSLILERATMDIETPLDDGDDAISLQLQNEGLRLGQLTIRECQQVTCLPESLRSLTSLQSLTIEDCEDLERIEDWFGELTKLKDLNINRCSCLLYLPVHKMTTLSWLSIEDCPLLFNAGGDVRVNERPEPFLPSSVEKLNISGISKECLSLLLNRPTMDSETPPDDGDAVSLQQPNMGLRRVTIKKCHQLTCLPEGLRSFMSLEHLAISNCGDLERIEDWLGELTKLEGLSIWSCQSLRYLPAHKMTTLRELFIRGCPLLFNADDGQFVDTNVDHIKDVQVNFRSYKYRKQE